MPHLPRLIPSSCVIRIHVTFHFSLLPWKGRFAVFESAACKALSDIIPILISEIKTTGPSDGESVGSILTLRVTGIYLVSEIERCVFMGQE